MRENGDGGNPVGLPPSWKINRCAVHGIVSHVPRLIKWGRRTASVFLERRDIGRFG